MSSTRYIAIDSARLAEMIQRWVWETGQENVTEDEISTLVRKIQDEDRLYFDADALNR